MRATCYLAITLSLLGCGSEAPTRVVEHPDAATESGLDAVSEPDTGQEPEPAVEAATEAESEAASDSSWGESDAMANVEAEAGCQDAPCLATSWNCDPACGPMDQRCSAVCDINGLLPVDLPFGTTTIQIPHLTSQSLGCSSCGSEGQWWTMLLRLPYQSCGDYVGPVGIGSKVTYVLQGDPAPTGCQGSSGGGCGTFASASGPNPLDTYLILVSGELVAGSLVYITVRHMGECSDVTCKTGCNGWPY